MRLRMLIPPPKMRPESLWCIKIIPSCLEPRRCTHFPGTVSNTVDHRNYAAVIRDAVRNKPTLHQFMQLLRSVLIPFLLCPPSICKNSTCRRALKNKLKHFGFRLPHLSVSTSLLMHVAHEIFKDVGSDEDITPWAPTVLRMILIHMKTFRPASCFPDWPFLLRYMFFECC